ncbi:methyltransferase domain-containing protein [Nocardia sp. NPDC050697]|uniref:class I SAM-dependent methyltransferase n=1 Tax=Nocardia sp. NPDC050697 TaxID=3155158 RepID=UPI00340B1E12
MPTSWLDRATRQNSRLQSGLFPHQASAWLDNPVRAAFSRHPRRLLDALALTGREHVLELGPGSGFFSRPVAAALPEGRLELFDVQPEMLAKARRKLERAGHRGVGFRTGDAGAGLPYSDNAFDPVFLVSVIGEVPDKDGCLCELHRVLKPAGLLVFLETFPDPERFEVDRLRALSEPHGFGYLDARGNRWHDLVRFRSQHSST